MSPVLQQVIHTGPEDFNMVNMVLQFPAGSSVTLCEEISIVDDNRIEPTEEFRVEIVPTPSTDNRVRIGPPSSTTVSIESKYSI